MRAIIIRRQGKTYQYIADKIGRSYSYVKEWNDRFKAEGPLGLLDCEPEFKPFFADELTEKKFRLRILAGPQEKDESSTWKRSDIQKILFEEYGIERSLATISNLMRKLKITYQIPRPTHPNKNEEAGQVWLNEELPFFINSPKNITQTKKLRSGSKTKLELEQKQG